MQWKSSILQKKLSHYRKLTRPNSFNSNRNGSGFKFNDLKLSIAAICHRVKLWSLGLWNWALLITNHLCWSDGQVQRAPQHCPGDHGLNFGMVSNFVLNHITIPAGKFEIQCKQVPTLPLYLSRVSADLDRPRRKQDCWCWQVCGRYCNPWRPYMKSNTPTESLPGGGGWCCGGGQGKAKGGWKAAGRGGSCARGPAPRGGCAGPGVRRMLSRQVGQVCCLWNHERRHAVWKMWLHGNFFDAVTGSLLFVSKIRLRS